MEYLSKMLDLEREIEKLKILNDSQLKYMDVNKRYNELNEFARKISEMRMKDSDRMSFLNRVSEYTGKIEEFRNSKKANDSGKAGMLYSVMYFLLGILAGKSGRTLLENYEKERNEKLSEYILDAIRKAEADEKTYNTSTETNNS